jgi:hypothetical protein
MPCCKIMSFSEERSAGNLHAAFCRSSVGLGVLSVPLVPGGKSARAYLSRLSALPGVLIIPISLCRLYQIPHLVVALLIPNHVGSQGYWSCRCRLTKIEVWTQIAKAI